MPLRWGMQAIRPGGGIYVRTALCAANLAVDTCCPTLQGNITAFYTQMVIVVVVGEITFPF